MRKLKTALLILTLAGPSVINMSCSNVFWRSLRDAAFDGVADFVRDTTFGTLNDNVNFGG